MDMLIVEIPGASATSDPLAQRQQFLEETRLANRPLFSAWRRLCRAADPTARGALRADLPPLHAFVATPARTSARLKLPPRLGWTLPCNATTAILQMTSRGARRSRVEAIFARSSWSKEVTTFETFEHAGKPCISGSDGLLFGHLVAVAHELGHCLYEETFGWQSTENVFRSEASALIVEDVVVRCVLRRMAPQPAPALADWATYRDHGDRVAGFFSQLERRQLFDQLALDSTPAPNGFLASRRSFVERIGMQWVYGFASAARQSLAPYTASASLDDGVDLIEGNASP